MDISVVIPAYNEEGYILNTIQSIIKWMPSRFQYEIIVVDHGSLDKTASIASSAGAKVIDGKNEKTVAALRNLGVSHSGGEILFFIDADITFSEEWSQNISKVVDDLIQNPDLISGSLPKVPETANPLIQSWFNPKTFETSPNYIGSCHLITSKTLFKRAGGFPENMETSEEFTFCKNAKEVGATIQARPVLIVTHHGAPKTLFRFVKSEIWHGRGDWTNLKSILASKVAILTLGFIFLHALLIASLLINNIPASAICIAIFLLCAGSSFIKFFKHGMSYFTLNTATFYFYFLGRSFSLVSAIASEKFGKRSRSK